MNRIVKVVENLSPKNSNNEKHVKQIKKYTNKLVGKAKIKESTPIERTNALINLCFNILIRRN